MPYVTYVELYVPETKKAAAFFKTVFGWDAQGWGEGDYMVASRGEEAGIDAGIDKLKDAESPRAVPVISVDSVDKYVKLVEEAGGTITSPKEAIPGVGYAANFTTPDGLMMSVYQADENAT